LDINTLSNMAPPQSPVHTRALSNGGKAAAESRTSFQIALSPSPPPTPTAWTPSSWTTKPIQQDVVYSDRAAVEAALHKLERLPPIVTPQEIIRLRRQLRDAAEGRAFLLQGGDCAELFDYCEAGAIEAKVKLLLQMSLVLIWGADKPVVRIARMAGQFAKPRSSATELLPDGRRVPSFRGDILNGYDVAQRTPDPHRLVDAYFHAAATSNYLRASLAAGLADLHSPLAWELGHVKDAAIRGKYARIVDGITESLRFMRTVGADGAGSGLESVELYTSHEGLVLEYEQTLTRRLPHPAGHADVLQRAPRGPGQRAMAAAEDGAEALVAADGRGWYNTSAHFLWIGDRTRQLHGAHVEYFRGLENAVGIKVGPTMGAHELVALLAVLDPHRLVGKVTVITRFGAGRVGALLGPLIEAVRRAGHVVVWQCDPMHGNTRATGAGVKTRRFDDVLAEVAEALRVHAAHGSFLGGVHLELTGEAVTECVGGSEGLTDDDLSLNYTSFCDPRLNEKQALELAFLVAGHFRAHGAKSEEPTSPETKS